MVFVPMWDDFPCRLLSHPLIHSINWAFTPLIGAISCWSAILMLFVRKLDNKRMFEKSVHGTHPSVPWITDWLQACLCFTLLWIIAALSHDVHYGGLWMIFIVRALSIAVFVYKCIHMLATAVHVQQKLELHSEVHVQSACQCEKELPLETLTQNNTLTAAYCA